MFVPAPLVTAENIPEVEGAIAWWDQQRTRKPSISPVALIKAIEDGDLAGYGEPVEAPSPCPLHGPERAALTEAWTALDARLTKIVGSSVRELWFDGAHLHAIGEEFVIASPPDRHSWISERYHRIIGQAAVVPVRFVVCEGVAG